MKIILLYNYHVNKGTRNISKSVGVMRLHCQLFENVIVKLYYSLVYSHLTYALLAWGISGSTNAAKRLGMHTGEHVDWSQIVTEGYSLFTQFVITLLCWGLSTHVPLVVIKCFRDKLSSHQPSHEHNTRHGTGRNLDTPLLIIQEPKSSSCAKLFPCGTAYQNFLKVALKSLNSENELGAASWHPNLGNVLRYQKSEQCLDGQCQQFQIHYICIYVSPNLVLLIFEFFQNRVLRCFGYVERMDKYRIGYTGVDGGSKWIACMK